MRHSLGYIHHSICGHGVLRKEDVPLVRSFSPVLPLWMCGANCWAKFRWKMFNKLECSFACVIDRGQQHEETAGGEHED